LGVSRREDNRHRLAGGWSAREAAKSHDDTMTPNEQLKIATRMLVSIGFPPFISPWLAMTPDLDDAALISLTFFQCQSSPISSISLVPASENLHRTGLPHCKKHRRNFAPRPTPARSHAPPGHGRLLPIQRLGGMTDATARVHHRPRQRSGVAARGAGAAAGDAGGRVSERRLTRGICALHHRVPPGLRRNWFYRGP
jgi:hypothetical protein